MSYLYLVLKYWRECIIAVLAFLLLICLFIQNHQFEGEISIILFDVVGHY